MQQLSCFSIGIKPLYIHPFRRKTFVFSDLYPIYYYGDTTVIPFSSYDSVPFHLLYFSRNISHPDRTSPHYQLSRPAIKHIHIRENGFFYLPHGNNACIFHNKYCWFVYPFQMQFLINVSLSTIPFFDSSTKSKNVAALQTFSSIIIHIPSPG